jgi:hypothetical protein
MYNVSKQILQNLEHQQKAFFGSRFIESNLYLAFSAWGSREACCEPKRKLGKRTNNYFKNIERLALFCTICANFLLNPRRIRSGQKDEEEGEYGLYTVVCCYLLWAALPPPHLSPHLAHHFTCPGPGLSGLEEQGRAPPPHPYPFGKLRLQREIWRMASNLEVVNVIADIGQQQWLFTFFGSVIGHL